MCWEEGGGGKGDPPTCSNRLSLRPCPCSQCRSLQETSELRSPFDLLLKKKEKKKTRRNQITNLWSSEIQLSFWITIYNCRSSKFLHTRINHVLLEVSPSARWSHIVTLLIFKKMRWRNIKIWIFHFFSFTKWVNANEMKKNNIFRKIVQTKIIKIFIRKLNNIFLTIYRFLRIYFQEMWIIKGMFALSL